MEYFGWLVVGVVTASIVLLGAVSLQVAPPSSEWTPAPPPPLGVDLFNSGKSNTPVLLIDSEYNIYVHGKWISDTNGLRP
jgi:hypothetical protein